MRQWLVSRIGTGRATGHRAAVASGVAAFAMLATPSGRAERILLTPVADATMIEVAPGNSSGGADFFNAGTTQNRTRNRGLLRFDAAALIPTNAWVTGASLQLQVTRVPSDGYQPSWFGLHRLLQPWGEGTNLPVGNNGGFGAPAQTNDATWNDRFAHTGQPWAAPGGGEGVDYFANFSSSAFVEGAGDPVWFESTLETIRDLRNWLSDPAQNYGWILISQSEELPFTARRFGSREDPSAAPQLWVDYVIIPEPQALMLFASGWVAVVLARRVWRRR